MAGETTKAQSRVPESPVSLRGRGGLPSRKTLARGGRHGAVLVGEDHEGRGRRRGGRNNDASTGESPGLRYHSGGGEER